MDRRSDSTAGVMRRDGPVRWAAGGPSLARGTPVRVGGAARRDLERRLGRTAGLWVGGAAVHRPGRCNRLVGSRPARPAADAGRPATLLRAPAGTAAEPGLGGAGPVTGPP